MPQKTFHYTNGEITIDWQPEICIHSAICVKGLGDVFDPQRRPWIDMSKSSTERIAGQVKKCPSGALSYTLNAAGPEDNMSPDTQAPKKAITIECLPDGPYLVQEAISLKKTDGTEELTTGTTALCRCGASATKPFCDGSHSRIGYKG